MRKLNTTAAAETGMGAHKAETFAPEIPSSIRTEIPPIQKRIAPRHMARICWPWSKSQEDDVSAAPAREMTTQETPKEDFTLLLTTAIVRRSIPRIKTGILIVGTEYRSPDGFIPISSLKKEPERYDSPIVNINENITQLK